MPLMYASWQLSMLCTVSARSSPCHAAGTFTTQRYHAKPSYLANFSPPTSSQAPGTGSCVQASSLALARMNDRLMSSTRQVTREQRREYFMEVCYTAGRFTFSVRVDLSVTWSRERYGSSNQSS